MMYIFTPNTLIESAKINANFIEATDVGNISNPYKFSAYKSGGGQNVTNTTATITFNSELFDTNNNFASNTYTVPITGFYLIGAGIRFDRPAAAGYNVPWLEKNGAEIARGTESIWPASAVVVTGVQKLLQLTAGDLMTVKTYCDGGTSSIYGGAGSDTQTYFYGHFVSAL